MEEFLFEAVLAMIPTKLRLSCDSTGEISGGHLVQDGALRADSFRFFAGMLEWGPGQLSLEIDSGIW